MGLGWLAPTAWRGVAMASCKGINGANHPMWALWPWPGQLQQVGAMHVRLGPGGTALGATPPNISKLGVGPRPPLAQSGPQQQTSCLGLCPHPPPTAPGRPFAVALGRLPMACNQVFWQRAACVGAHKLWVPIWLGAAAMGAPPTWGLQVATNTPKQRVVGPSGIVALQWG